MRQAGTLLWETAWMMTMGAIYKGETCGTLADCETLQQHRYLTLRSYASATIFRNLCWSWSTVQMKDFTSFLLFAVGFVVLLLHVQTCSAVVCGFAQRPCGTRCYRPSSGARCLNGVVCPFAHSLCGKRCYKPSSGARCFSGGIVCPFAHTVCGKRCYKPSSGARCFSGGIVCPFAHSVCGKRCYKPSSGARCFSGGIVCPFAHRPCSTRCYKPSAGQRCFGWWYSTSHADDIERILTHCINCCLQFFYNSFLCLVYTVLTKFILLSNIHSIISFYVTCLLAPLQKSVMPISVVSS